MPRQPAAASSDTHAPLCLSARCLPARLCLREIVHTCNGRNIHPERLIWSARNITASGPCQELLAGCVLRGSALIWARRQQDVAQGCRSADLEVSTAGQGPAACLPTARRPPAQARGCRPQGQRYGAPGAAAGGLAFFLTKSIGYATSLGWHADLCPSRARTCTAAVHHREDRAPVDRPLGSGS